ncbi:hypothetical protein LO771_11995 [Streptacidiphilus sp. ASG 303]|uniref:hypothetical protein n=1 Tax=Streptacidiphilus sp. ASG 303 TaxID=2896847 RepID=UPI001E4DC2E4|nr:hypothetical protein [Streptacidiphilus sp. ASG 303]MCD0483106.1 hypothetical protein [Streptacidiphilus sp. ASG 303]
MRTGRPVPVQALLAVLLAAVAALLGPVGAARAATGTGEIAAALRRDPVYVDPAVRGRLSAADTAALSARIRESGVPVFVAVLPDDPAYGGNAVFDRLRTAVGRPGVYAVALGSRFGAASDSSVLPGRTAQQLAARNVREHRGQPAAILDGFVADVEASLQGGGAPRSGGGGGGGGGGLLVGVLAAAAVAGGGLLLVRRASRRRRREEERAALEQVRGAVDEDITSYGETLDRLDFDPAAPGTGPEMLDDYRTALDAYERAKQAQAAAARPEDVRAVTEALEEGRFALARLDARRTGRPLPERRPPCFFDPRHGPSVRDADWAPPGGAVRPVPVCAADAVRIEDGLEPVSRTVPTAGGRVPYWEAGPAYAPWSAGYFGGYGSMLLPGLLVGTALGGSLGPWGYGDGGFSGGLGDGGGDGGDGGDFGGGFGDGGGGGDFGGGFGGGDGGGGGF